MNAFTIIIGLASVSIGLLILVLFYGIGVYNHLVNLGDRTKNSFAQIEVQLQRRYDLIPNLVEIAKGYMAHERETLEAVISARNQAKAGLSAVAGNQGDANAMMTLAAAEQGLSGSLGRLFALAEAYPDLKANQNMMQLTEELTTTENKISFARQAYNDTATAYNVYRKQFPPVIIAGMTGHTTDKQLLEFNSAAIADAPKVSFG